MQQLEQVRNDDYIQGVLLYVNSPGGGVMESAQIRDKILQIQKNAIFHSMFPWGVWQHQVDIIFPRQPTKFCK